MSRKITQPPGEIAPTSYRITVRGNLSENWADLFNGMLIDFMNDIHSGPITVLICQVQDQAELTGILNWLHNMNLTLLEVTAVREEKNDGGQK